jgi:hypothetical protein
MKNTKKQKRPAAEEEAGGNKKFTRRKRFQSREERTRLPKKTTKRKRENYAKRFQNLLQKSNKRACTQSLPNDCSCKTKQQQEGEVEKDGTRKDQTRPDPTGPDRTRDTQRRETDVNKRFFFLFFWDKFILKMAKQCVFLSFQVARFLQIFNKKSPNFSLYWVLACSQKM